MKITYLGHACISIETHDKTIIVDPFISANPLASNIDISKIQADYILLTHAHGDHILDVEKIAKKDDTQIISNHEIVTYYQKRGYKGHGMNIGGSWHFDFGTIHAVNALHSSSFPDGSYGGNPIGFVLDTKHHRIYIAGDTALYSDMKLIPEMIGKIDLAVLPVGENYTMGPKSALKASEIVEVNKILGVHFDTFPLIKIDHEVAEELFRKSHKELILLSIGSSIKL